MLLDRLHHLDEAPWGDWYGRPFEARDLAKKLRPYGIRSRDVRFGPDAKDKAKGYRVEDFEDAWIRYLPAPLNEGDQRRQGDNSTVATQGLSPCRPMSPFLEGELEPYEPPAIIERFRCETHGHAIAHLRAAAARHQKQNR